jgi:hypothetical protein
MLALDFQIDLEMVPHMQQRVEALCRHPNDDGFACFSHKSQNEFVLTTPSRCLKSLKPLPGKKHHFPIYLRFPFVQDKSLQKFIRKGFHENYDILSMKPHEPDYPITKCTATPLVLARSQIKPRMFCGEIFPRKHCAF